MFFFPNIANTNNFSQNWYLFFWKPPFGCQSEFKSRDLFYSLIVVSIATFAAVFLALRKRSVNFAKKRQLIFLFLNDVPTQLLLNLQVAVPTLGSNQSINSCRLTLKITLFDWVRFNETLGDQGCPIFQVLTKFLETNTHSRKKVPIEFMASIDIFHRRSFTNKFKAFSFCSLLWKTEQVVLFY